LGGLEELKKDKSRLAKQLDEFCAYQRAERGLSANTIEARRKQVADFLELLDRRSRSLRQVTVGDVDSYFTLKGIQGCCRLTIRTRADSLRSFFRYAEFRHWCITGIAAGITAPRVFKYEGVPAGPSWQQVRQIIAGANGAGPGDARDRAILLLLATYGLRSSEIRGLRLEDLDWVMRSLRSGDQRGGGLSSTRSLAQLVTRSCTIFSVRGRAVLTESYS
jgi:site-specific recombinase XerD